MEVGECVWIIGSWTMQPSKRNIPYPLLKICWIVAGVFQNWPKGWVSSKTNERGGCFSKDSEQCSNGGSKSKHRVDRSPYRWQTHIEIGTKGFFRTAGGIGIRTTTGFPPYSQALTYIWWNSIHEKKRIGIQLTEQEWNVEGEFQICVLENTDERGKNNIIKEEENRGSKILVYRLVRVKSQHGFERSHGLYLVVAV